MAKRWKTALPGPSRLSQILANLRKAPRPGLPGLKALRLTLAQKNDHFGARHFLRDDLPRIRYANPRLDISVDKKPKKANEKWNAEVVLEFSDGRVEQMNVDNLWSSQILERILDAAGGNPWARWKETRAAQGLPPLDAPEVHSPPPPKAPKRRSSKTGAHGLVDGLFADPNAAKPDFSKSGAAVVLP